MFVKLSDLMESTNVEQMNLRITRDGSGRLEVIITSSLKEGVKPVKQELQNQMAALTQPIMLNALPDEFDAEFPDFLSEYIQKFKSNSNSFKSALENYSGNNSTKSSPTTADKAKAEISSSVMNQSSPKSL